jgi:hypothetical protein
MTNPAAEEVVTATRARQPDGDETSTLRGRLTKSRIERDEWRCGPAA